MANKTRRLTEEAEAHRADFTRSFGDGNCSCHIFPPCSSCVHPGNPANQDDDDECWEAIEVYRIEPGRDVQCDGCSKDFTNSPESGGIYGLGTKAYGPCCAARMLKTAEQCGELEFITARCPPGKSFADWVREDLR